MYRRPTAWLALLALVLGSLAPGLAPPLAQAVAAGSGPAGWVQVCSASGMFWVRADADPANPAPPLVDGSAACPWCSLHGGAAGLPPAVAWAVAAPERASLPPAPLLAGPGTRLWARAQARAPPLLA